MTSGAADVVIVDDAEDVRLLVRMQLELSQRFEVVAEGRSGLDAIDLADTIRPRVMLLDLSMPDMDGVEAILATTAVQVWFFRRKGWIGPFHRPAVPLRTLDPRTLRGRRRRARGYDRGGG